MMKKAIGVSLLSLFLTFSSTPIASAITIAELQAQINALMLQLSALQATQGVTTAPGTSFNIQDNPNGDSSGSTAVSTGFQVGDTVKSTYSNQ